MIAVQAVMDPCIEKITVPTASAQTSFMMTEATKSAWYVSFLEKGREGQVFILGSLKFPLDQSLIASLIFSCFVKRCNHTC